MYSKIVNPRTGRTVSIYNKLGKRILNNYLNQLGGVLGMAAARMSSNQRRNNSRRKRQSNKKENNRIGTPRLGKVKTKTAGIKVEKLSEPVQTTDEKEINLEFTHTSKSKKYPKYTAGIHEDCLAEQHRQKQLDNGKCLLKSKFKKDGLINKSNCGKSTNRRACNNVKTIFGKKYCDWHPSTQWCPSDKCKVSKTKYTIINPYSLSSEREENNYKYCHPNDEKVTKEKFKNLFKIPSYAFDKK